jgi:predicted lipoprotein with Yx(FWY)xxD motif
MSAFKRAAVLTASVAAVVGAATACTASYGSSAAAPARPAASAPASTAAAGAQQGSGSNSAAGGAALIAAASRSLGAIVTDASGMTLYRFDKDTANPSASNCNGSCAGLWPPATVADSVSLRGVDKSLVGTVTRSDGTKQLTLNGWPLYTYAGDTAPGQTNGQGVGGTWYAVTPAGGKAKAAAGSNTASGYGSGYGAGASATPTAGTGGW